MFAILLLDRLLDNGALNLGILFALGRVDILRGVDSLDGALTIGHLLALVLDDRLNLSVIHHVTHIFTLLDVVRGALVLHLLHILCGALGVRDGATAGLGNGLALAFCYSAALLVCHSLMSNSQI